MSRINTNPNVSAFPSGSFNAGLSTREYFAAMALQGLLANKALTLSTHALAEQAVMHANALIIELNHESNQHEE